MADSSLSEQAEPEIPVEVPTPQEVADLDIPETLVSDIALRRALLDGQTSTLRLASALAVTPMLMERVIETMRHMRNIEVHGLE